MIKIRYCDLCHKEIGPADETRYKLINQNEVIDYKIIRPLDNSFTVDVCEDCVSKIVAEKFQIGKGAGVKE
jgi:hypothetical protein